MRETLASIIILIFVISIVEPEAIGRWYQQIAAGFTTAEAVK